MKIWKFLASKMPKAEKEKIYREVWKEYVKEDVLARLHDAFSGEIATLKNTDEDLYPLCSIVASRYVDDGEYDCNLNYWQNLDFLIFQELESC